MKNRWWFLILSLFFIVVSVYLLSKRSPNKEVEIFEVNYSSGSVLLSLSTTDARFLPNQSHTVNLNIDTGSNHVSAVQVELTYDPAKIKVDSINQGNFLTQILAEPVISNGVVTFTYAAPPDSGGLTGNGILATIEVTPTVAGSSTIAFSANTQAASVENESNDLKEANDLTLTVRLAADIFPDGAVNLYDYNILVAEFGQTGANLQADIVINQAVDIYDYNLLVSTYGQSI